MGKNLTDRIACTPKGRQILEQERLILDATELICHTLERAGISKSELAKRLGKSKGRVSQLLDGSRNMTLRTLADIFTALGERVELRTASPPYRVAIQTEEIALRPRPTLWCMQAAVHDSLCLEGSFDGQVA